MPRSSTNLWREVARQCFVWAQAHGYTGNLEPNALDNEMSSMRKTCFYTAFIVDNP